MKTLLTSCLIAITTLSASAQAADLKVTPALAKKICQLVVKEAAKESYDIPEYTLSECMEKASISISEEYRPTSSHPERYQIDMNDAPISLEGTDLWIACELNVEGPLKASAIKLNWCSIEQ